MRKFALNLAVMAVSVVIFLGLAEVGVRVLRLAPPALSGGDGAEPMRKVLEFDPKLETRYRPNAETTVRSPYGEFTVAYAFNELGLRERPLSGISGGVRVLALGNSFIEGWGVEVEKTFLRVAERHLNARRAGDGRPVRIINGGIAGYGAAQALLLLRELTTAIRPDAVVFFHVATMVPADHRFIRRASVDDQRLVTGLSLEAFLGNQEPTMGGPEAGPPTLPAWVQTAARYSHLVRLVASRVSNYVALKRVVPGDPASDLLAAYRAPATSLATLYEPTLRHVGGMARVARQAGVPFVVVQLPMPFELSPVEWAEGRKAYGLESRRYAVVDEPVVTAYCREHGLQCVAAHDHVASLAAQSASAPKLFYTYDFHWNTAGHEVMGKWLADVLAQRLGFPRADGIRGRATTG